MVITSLPLPRIVEDVALGPNGIAANAKPGTTYIDLSTNAPATARRCAEGMQAKGIGMLEAPVSGGTARAKDGTIVIMVGGDPATFEPQLPLLKSFSGEVVHCGEIGMGSVAKLINNMLAFCNSAAAAEALMIGKRSGIDLKKLDQVIRNASGMSSGYGNMATKAFKGDSRPTFALDLAHKDLRLALETGRRTGRARDDRATGDEPDAHGARHGARPVGFLRDDPGLRNRAGHRGARLIRSGGLRNGSSSQETTLAGLAVINNRARGEASTLVATAASYNACVPVTEYRTQPPVCAPGSIYSLSKMTRWWRRSFPRPWTTTTRPAWWIPPRAALHLA